MKIQIFLLAMIIYASETQARIFKCEDEAGKIDYQSSPCKEKTEQSIITIHDPTKPEISMKERMRKNFSSGEFKNPSPAFRESYTPSD